MHFGGHRIQWFNLEVDKTDATVDFKDVWHPKTKNCDISYFR